MKVIIKNTNRIEELTIADHYTGIDYSMDLLGNAGIHADADADTDAVTMDQEDFEWWQNYIEGHEATERECEELAAQAGVQYSEIQVKVFEYMGQQDMENERDRAIQMLAELREEYGVA